MPDFSSLTDVELHTLISAYETDLRALRDEDVCRNANRAWIARMKESQGR